LCKFIVDNPIDILLKCRVVSVSQLKDGVFDVSIYTNQGITHIFAKNIIDTVQKTINKVMTVLFTSNDIDKDSALLRSVFKTVAIEPAFYDGRYALRINVNDYDENSAKLFIYNNWRKLDTQAKIVYIAPTFLREKSNVSLNDANYDNPICALDAGYFYAKGGHNDTI
jgi:CDP-glycerol glycerophosphotransferase (TagB/SpsB family)